jgi:hypothetical protein
LFWQKSRDVWLFLIKVKLFSYKNERGIPMKKLMFAALAVVFALGMIGSPVWAQAQSKTNTMTITVDEVLTLAGNAAVSFNFSDFVSGTAADSTQLVNYTLKNNNTTDAALTGVIAAKLDTNLVHGVDITATPGTYVNNGTAGNIDLDESAGKIMTTSDQDLGDKAVTTGNQKRVIRGTFPITWSAVSTLDLPTVDPTGNSYTTNVIVTQKTA